MQWQKLYESCVSERNPDKLEKLVLQLEEVIVLRYHDLAHEPNGPELQAVRRAAEQLHQLKIKLGRSHQVKHESRILWINWRTLATRIQAALLVTERAWQNWVFKSSK